MREKEQDSRIIIRFLTDTLGRTYLLSRKGKHRRNKFEMLIQQPAGDVKWADGWTSLGFRTGTEILKCLSLSCCLKM